MSVLVHNVTELNAALATANPGLTIQLAPGTYTGVVLTNYNFAGTVTISSAQSGLGQEAVFKDLNLSNSSGLLLSNIEFSSAGSTAPTSATQFNVVGCSNVTLDNLTVHGDPNGTLATDASGLLVRNSSNISVTNSTFYHLHYAITQINDQYLNIAGNTLTHIWDDGVRGGGSSYINIANNNFSSFHMDSSDPDHPDCIQFWTTNQTVSAHDITISGNTYSRGDGNAVQGVFVEEDSNLPYSNVVVENNDFVGSLYNGIYVAGAMNSIVANNTLNGFYDIGTSVRILSSNGVLVTGNRAGQYVTTEGNTGLELLNNSILAPEAPTTVSTVAPLSQLYDTYVGRDPTAAELSNAEGRIGGGETLAGVRADLLATSESATFVQNTIVSLYDTLLGQDPSAAASSQWQNLIAAGSDFNALRQSLLSSTQGQAHVASALTSIYDAYDGRDPTSPELGSWEALLGADGSNIYTFANVQQAIASSVEGQAHTALEVKSIYDTYMGRDPGPSEAAYWVTTLSSGAATPASFRATVLNDPYGQAHTNATITSLYDTYFGRDPQASELSFWQAAISAGDDFNSLRAALVNDPAGRAHVAATVTSLYDIYFGRDPQVAELAVWQGLIAGGDDFSSLRAALAGDPVGQAHTASQITSLYDTYFGRDPQAAEIAFWQGELATSQGYDQVQDTLERYSSSAGVQHIVASPAAQSFNLSSTAAYATIDNFNATLDTLVLSGARYGKINPLDASHARQITAVDGTTDVLLTLDASHSVLLEHTQLALLHPADFLFG